MMNTITPQYRSVDSFARDYTPGSCQIGTNPALTVKTDWHDVSVGRVWREILISSVVRVGKQS
jgi:hypothetical protein